MAYYCQRCPRCGHPAYVGLISVDCSGKYCRHHPDISKLGVLAAEKVERLWAQFSVVQDVKIERELILSQIAAIVEAYHSGW